MKLESFGGAYPQEKYDRLGREADAELPQEKNEALKKEAEIAWRRVNELEKEVNYLLEEDSGASPVTIREKFEVLKEARSELKEILGRFADPNLASEISRQYLEKQINSAAKKN